jgi:hypothetical protein
MQKKFDDEHKKKIAKEKASPGRATSEPPARE